METKRTPLYEEHIKLGAKMFPFAGWEMPLQYTSVKEEHLTVRNEVGIFDVSHMGQVFISGTDALSYLQNLVPQDVAKLNEGRASYSMLVNEHGGIIDDLIIYRLKDKYLLIVNASRIEQDLSRLLAMQKDYDVVIENKSEELAMIAVQGPKASELVEKIGIKKQDQPSRFCIKEDNDMLIARTGYTGEDGFEIIIKNNEVAELWQKLLENGGKPVGYAARDTLRLEASLLLYGQDMDENTTPIEAALCWAIPRDKQADYAGKDIILNQMLTKNVNKKLVKFKMLDKSIPRHDYRIYIENEDTGRVTSGGFSPCANTGIGLGFIDTNTSLPEGTKIDIMIRGKLHPAQIIKNRFIRLNRRIQRP